MYFSWRKWLKGPTKPIRKPASIRPRLESLEDRTTPATITVTSASDTVVAGVVTLREAIQSIDAGKNIDANVNAVGNYGTNDTINFNIGDGVQTISVAVANGALPALSTAVIVDGSPSAAHPTQVV